MAGKKTTNNPAAAKGPPAVTGVEGTDAPVSGKLRRTSPKTADGVEPLAKKPKAKNSETLKEERTTTPEVAANAPKLSALDAAAKVLQESGQPMNCQEMIQVMAAKGYWSSPAGKTPAATLYSAITRETKTKGNQARFLKTGRGQFVYQTPQAS
jgi:hypothetical protein